MEKRYKALRFIGSLYKVLGVILLTITILAAIGICGISIWGGVAFESIGQDLGAAPDFTDFFGSVFGGLFVGFLVILYGGFVSLTTFAFGEGIYLLLALEENTRSSSMLLQRQINQEIPPQQPPPAQNFTPTAVAPVQPVDQVAEGDDENAD